VVPDGGTARTSNIRKEKRTDRLVDMSARSSVAELVKTSTFMAGHEWLALTF